MLRVNARVRTLRDDLTRRLDKLAELGRMRAVIGWWGADTPYESGSGQPITTPQLGAVHEYGTIDGRIRARRPLRSTMEARERQLRDFVIGQTRECVIEETIAPRVVVGRIGTWFVGAVRERVGAREITPMNSEVTVFLKGSSTPLIDTGTLINQALTYEVRLDSDVPSATGQP